MLTLSTNMQMHINPGSSNNHIMLLMFQVI
jgi:hypothetical protein